MDAALDAMGQFGFQKQRVREAVRKLLRVYGGDDGWPFIEEDYYRVLLEALLEKDGSQDDARSLKDTETSTAGPSSGVTTRSYAKFQTLKTNLQIEAALNSIKDTEPSNAGSSSRVSAPDCSELETANTNLLTDTTVNSQSTKAMDFDPETNKEGAKDSNPPTKQGGEGNLADENLKLNFTKNDVDSFLDSEIQTDKPQIVFAKDSGYDKNTSNYPIHSPNQECSLSLRKRRHYHGWVSASS
uniref:WIYLD domain-containing protein n=1 Tax=Cannabis sativa TaxID=3483 RepID=A0A803P1E7_CANSA